MTAPPLPEVFGNYALTDFVEVATPAAISWLPQTVGWTWLAVLTAVVGLRYLWRALRKWHRNRYRKEALHQLQALQQQLDAGNDSSDEPRDDPRELVAAVNRVLKLAALVAYSRTQVAQLSGEDWVDFLNGQCDQPPFAPQQAQLLAISAYRADPVTVESAHQILAASILWLRRHRGTHHA